MTGPRAIVVGGGAAGFFAAIAAAEAGASVDLLERGPHGLAKVRVSGGGRCNVTHACFDPKKLIESFPRGGKELLGPFHRFQARDTMAWFESRGVTLKIESDGRVFPKSDNSESIIDALKIEARKTGVRFRGHGEPNQVDQLKSGFEIRVGGGIILGDRLLLATGSSPAGYRWAQRLGHGLVPPVPSLFTFTIPDPRLKGLAGVSAPAAQVALLEDKLRASGAVLITHWGLSGPAILRLSAWGARALHGRGYRAILQINWVGRSKLEVSRELREMAAGNPRRCVRKTPALGLSARLWERLTQSAGVEEALQWANASTPTVNRLAEELTAGLFQIQGKGVFKEEFVTAGGIPLNEVNFKTMESRRCPGLFFAGEILDIDGVTGGFNFQSAWTTGWLAGRSMAESPL